MIRTASAIWQGSLKEGSGQLSMQSGVFNQQPYAFNTRFGEAKGTNPEELIGAAHAGCFSMALSSFLNNAGLTAERIDTKASVTLTQESGGFSITAIHLDVTAKVPGTDNSKFVEIANNAKENCPVSKVLNAKITMDAKLL